MNIHFHVAFLRNAYILWLYYSTHLLFLRNEKSARENFQFSIFSFQLKKAHSQNLFSIRINSNPKTSSVPTELSTTSRRATKHFQTLEFIPRIKTNSHPQNSATSLSNSVLLPSHVLSQKLHLRFLPNFCGKFHYSHPKKA